MPRLILHMGLHKTGTTAIQNSLAAAGNDLLKQGIWYPRIRDHWGRRIEAQHPLFHAIAGQKNILTEEKAMAHIQAWKSPPRRSVHTLIASSESLSRHIITSSKGDWAAARQAFLEKLAEIFSDFQIQPVIVIRRQDEFIRSFYQEHVRKGTAAGSRMFRVFREQYQNKSLRFLKNIELTERYLAKPTILIYEDLAANNNLVNNFLANLDIDSSEIAPTGNQQVRLSLSPEETLVKRHINQMTGPFTENREAVIWLQSRPGRRCIAKIRPTTDIWESPEARESFLKQFAAENESIRERYCPERARLFPNLEVTEDANYRDELSPEEKQIVDRALRTIPRWQLMRRYGTRLKRAIKRRLS